MSDRTAEARAWFAEDIRVTGQIKTRAITDAIARVPRERFLGPGPWLLYGEAGPQSSDDADPRHVYHNMPVAIDAARNLYNGQPGLIARWLDQVGIAKGQRVLHIGCATGYFTALMADVVGPTGAVHAFDVDEMFVERARGNLADWPWVHVSHGDGRTNLPAQQDIVIVHAGASHVLDEWLDALADGGRLLLPLTGIIPGMPAGIGKGMMLLVRRSGDAWPASVFGMVMIYSLVGARDESRAAKLGQAMMSGALTKVKRLRRDPHEETASCALHGPSVCLSTDVST